MGKKTLDVTSIANELQEASVFFGKKPAPLPEHSPRESSPSASPPPPATSVSPEYNARNSAVDLSTSQQTDLPTTGQSDKLTSQRIDKSTNQHVDESTSHQIDKSTTKPPSTNVNKSTNQQPNHLLKRFTTYLAANSIKSMKIIALEENRNDYEVFQEAVEHYLKSRGGE